MIHMQMTLGEHLQLTLFGTSHGPLVGAYLEGVPKGIKIDRDEIQKAMDKRKPGGKFASKRKESDNVELRTGISQETTNGEKIEISIKNKDARSSDYSFIPDHPRPGHQDMVMLKRTNGEADLRGGGTSSARLTAPIVAAAAIIEPILSKLGIKMEAHVSAIGGVEARPINQCPEKWASESCQEIRCQDPDVAESMIELIQSQRKSLDSIGSKVELCISGLPLGLGEPWFDGVEPALSRAMMAIPAARGVSFGHGFEVVKMSGSEHNSAWGGTNEKPILEGENPDGALAGLATGSDLLCSVAFKPPSSIAKEQLTLNLKTNKKEILAVRGRHDPVLGPRAVSVVEAMAKLVVCDLIIRGGFFNE
jgi:chorismate synthase